MFDHSGDFSVCSEAGNSLEAKESLRELTPDLIILDLSLGGDDGPALIKFLVDNYPPSKIIVYSALNEMTYGERAIRNGACGYVMKHRRLDELLDAAKRVVRGEIAVSDRLNSYLLHQRRNLSTECINADAAIANLTDRELQVLRLIGSGLSTGEIAKKLFLSPKTVGAHRESLKNKFAVASGSDLVHRAVSLFNQGIV